MQTRSSARNTKKKEVTINQASRQGSKDIPLSKAHKKNEVTSPPEEPSSPGSPQNPSPRSRASSSSDVDHERGNEHENGINHSPNAAVPNSSNSNISLAALSSKESTRPLSRSMTLRSSSGAVPKRRIWSPESFKKDTWSDEVKFNRLASKKGPRKQIPTYETDDSSSESSEMDRRVHRPRSRKASRRSRKFDSSDGSLDEQDEDSDSEDSDDESDEDSYDSEEELRDRKRKLRSKTSHRKRKLTKQGVKSDTEGAEALMGLADSVLIMDEEPRRKTPRHSTPDARPLRKHRPRPPVKDERSRDPEYDIRNLLVPPPVFPKMASGNVPETSTPTEQPIWKRGALHAAIAYYVFYQQRYDLLQQLSVPNAQYAQKFLLALSLDPTAEAKMLRERSQAARQQLMRSKGHDPQPKITPEHPVALSPSPFSLYPNASPSTGFSQPQARVTPKPLPISLSPATPRPPGYTPAPRAEASQSQKEMSANNVSTFLSPSPQAPTTRPPPSTPMVLDTTTSSTPQDPTASSTHVGHTVASRLQQVALDLSLAERTPTIANLPPPATQATLSTLSNTISTEQSPSPSTPEHPSTPTSENTSLEADLGFASTRAASQLRSAGGQEEVDETIEFEPTLLNFEDDCALIKSEPPEPAKSDLPKDYTSSLNESTQKLRKEAALENQPPSAMSDKTDPNATSTSRPSSNTFNTEITAPMELDQPFQKPSPFPSPPPSQPSGIPENQKSTTSTTSKTPTTATSVPSAQPQPTSTSASTSEDFVVELEAADWSSYPLGPTFRKGRLSMYTPAQVMVSPFNYLMTSADASRPFKYNNNSEVEDVNKSMLYAEYQRQQHAQYHHQRHQYMSKPYQHPFSMHPHYYSQPPSQAPPPLHNSRTSRSQTYMPSPHYTRSEEEARHDPNANRHPLEHPYYIQPQPPNHSSHFQSPEWHHQYMQHQNQARSPQAESPQYGSSQTPSTQSSNAPFHLDQRTSIMLRVNPPPVKAQDNNTQQSRETPTQDGESRTQQYTNMLYKHPPLTQSQPTEQTQQTTHARPVPSTQLDQQTQQATQQTQQSQTIPQAPTQSQHTAQQQLSMRHSTENLAHLKRQIRSKALARGGSVFGGSLRRNVQMQQQLAQQQQTNQPQPPQSIYQSVLSGDQSRYIVISDDNEVQRTQQPSNQEKPLEQVSFDLTTSENEKSDASKPPPQAQQYQLQQQLQQQQMRMLHQQREQAALLEYQKQMYQRALMGATNAPDSPHKEPTQPISTESTAHIVVQPNTTSESAPAHPGSQHNLQRLQNLHFQFKQQQRLQQLQKQPHALQVVQQPTTQQGAQQTPQSAPQPSQKQSPSPQYLAQYTQYQQYPNHTNHLQFHQAQPVTSISIQPTHRSPHLQTQAQQAQQPQPQQSQQLSQQTQSSQPQQSQIQQSHSQQLQAQPHPQPQSQSQPQPQPQSQAQSQHQPSQSQSNPSQQLAQHQQMHPPQNHPPSHLMPQQQVSLQRVHQLQQQEKRLQQSRERQPQSATESTDSQKSSLRLSQELQPSQQNPQPQPQTAQSQPQPTQSQPSKTLIQAQQYIMKQTANKPTTSQSQSQPVSTQHLTSTTSSSSLTTSSIPAAPRTPAQTQGQQWQYIIPQYPQKGAVTSLQTNPQPNAKCPPGQNHQYTVSQQHQQQIILQQQQQTQPQPQPQSQAQQQTQQSGPILMQFTQVSPTKFRKPPAQTPRSTQSQPRSSQQPQTPTSQPSQVSPPSQSLSQPQTPLSPTSSSSSQNIQPPPQPKLQLEALVRPPKQENARSTVTHQ